MARFRTARPPPYLPVIELLKSYFAIQERDDPRAIRERVVGKLLTLDRALESLLSPLLALLEVPVDDAIWDALDRAQRRQRTLEAVKQLLLRESQGQPVLVLFEDLHWIDAETQAFLDGLVEGLPTARVLLLVNYRPEYEHAWGRKTYYIQMRIDPLPPENAEALLTALLGEDRTLDPLKRVLIDRTEGNPFFLEESVRSLVETNVLVGSAPPIACRRRRRRGGSRQRRRRSSRRASIGSHRTTNDFSRPPPLSARTCPWCLLQAIADIPDDPLRQGLARLQVAEFLYETSLFPDIEYTFKHALTHDVAYSSLLQDRRRALHARILALDPDRTTSSG